MQDECPRVPSFSLGVDGADGWTQWMCSWHWAVHFKTNKMVNLILHVFYRNKRKRKQNEGKFLTFFPPGTNSRGPPCLLS